MIAPFPSHVVVVVVVPSPYTRIYILLYIFCYIFPQLAIIGISDHFTRMQTGGSVLPPSSPTIGLLYGYQSGFVISIIDAEEVEYICSTPGPDDAQKLQNIRTKIELHQTCFPKHEVVGWYRVSSIRSGREEPLPVEEDMVMNHGWMKEFNEHPLFVLMDGWAAEKTEERNRNKGERDDSMQLNAGEEAREKMDRDEQLPLTMFETVMTDHGPLFVNLDFELEVRFHMRLYSFSRWHSHSFMICRRSNQNELQSKKYLKHSPILEL